MFEKTKETLESLLQNKVDTSSLYSTKDIALEANVNVGVVNSVRREMGITPETVKNIRNRPSYFYTREQKLAILEAIKAHPRRQGTSTRKIVARIEERIKEVDAKINALNEILEGMLKLLGKHQ